MAGSRHHINEEDYRRAERLLPWNLKGLAKNVDPDPRWLGGGRRFWYRRDTPTGHEFVVVDAKTGERMPALDHARLAAALSRSAGIVTEHKKLPIEEVEFAAEVSAVEFDAGGRRWRCDLDSYALEGLGAPRNQSADRLASPDGRWVAFVKDHDIFVQATDGETRRRLTDDGEPHHDYGTRPESYTYAVTDRLAGTPLPPLALWSPDGTKLLTHRLDQRRVGSLHLVQSVGSDVDHRPILHSYRYALPGEEQVPTAELVIFDVQEGGRITVDHPALECPTFSPFQYERVWWSDDGRQAYLVDQTRDYKELRLVEVDSATGAARVVIEERGDKPVDPNLYIFNRPNIRALSTGEVVWFSERDGWGHLYLYDGASGDLDGRITSGEWVVRDILHVDEEDRVIYFTGGGHEEGRNPYYRHLYRAGLDGSGMELLTPEDADHEVSFASDGSHFVDVYSRVNLPPRTVLRASDGRLVCEVEQADTTSLLDIGWTAPEPFAVLASDGETEIHGVIHHPSNFDPELKYPVIDSIYPGPQHLRSHQSFGKTLEDSVHALAELGFVVVTIEGSGTPLRSRAFLDASYGRLEIAGGLEDHIEGLKNLGAGRPYLDLDRVGIYGHSAGGYATARAMLSHPGFYKVGVSSAGNHDQRINVALWGERYIGLPSDVDYHYQANPNFAADLEGKLLLAYADMDDNVHPAGTTRLVDALIRANKDFDLLLLPNRNHIYMDDPYLTRRRWDFFVRHLHGTQPPEGYSIAGPDEA